MALENSPTSICLISGLLGARVDGAFPRFPSTALQKLMAATPVEPSLQAQLTSCLLERLWGHGQRLWPDGINGQVFSCVDGLLCGMAAADWPCKALNRSEQLELQCMNETDNPVKCVHLRDDYLECLHHRKEVPRLA